MVHEAWVAAGDVAFVTVDGWDVNWVEGAFEPAAAGRFAFDMDAAFGLLAKEPRASFRLG
jgi:hypothetical protein